MSAQSKFILIALIGALSSIGTAWVTANGVAANKTTETISASGSEIAALRKQIDAAAKKAEDARLAAEQALAPCPPFSAANLGSARTFLKTNEGRTPAVVELLALNGSGCLVSGAILGFYFQRLQGDTATPSRSRWTARRTSIRPRTGRLPMRRATRRTTLGCCPCRR